MIVCYYIKFFMQPGKTNSKTTKPLSLMKTNNNKEVKVIEKEVIKPKQGFT